MTKQDLLVHLKTPNVLTRRNKRKAKLSSKRPICVNVLNISCQPMSKKEHLRINDHIRLQKLTDLEHLSPPASTCDLLHKNF